MVTTVVNTTAQMGPAFWTIVASLFVGVGALFSLSYHDASKRGLNRDQLTFLSGAASCSAGLLSWLRL